MNKIIKVDKEKLIKEKINDFIYLVNGQEKINTTAFTRYIEKQKKVIYYAGKYFYYNSGYYKKINRIETFIHSYLPDNFKNARTVNEVVNNLNVSDSIEKTKFDLTEDKYINFKNGIYDIEKKELIPHNSNMIFLSQIPYNYNENAEKDEKTEKYLDNCSDNDIQLKELLLEMIGVAISDIRCFKNWFFIKGKKDTGKSTFCGVIMKLLTDTESNIKMYSSLSMDKLDEECFDLHNILDKKVNLDTDTKYENIKSLSTIKKLTGGENEELTLKIKNKESVIGVSRAMLMFAGNNSPKIWSSGDKKAFIDRMIMIEFNYVVPPEEQVKNLINKINYEYLIKEAIKCLHTFIDNNYEFYIPDCVESSRKRVTEESDDIENFYNNVCNGKEKLKISARYFYSIFKNWLIENGELNEYDKSPITAKHFKSRIIELGAEYKKSLRINENKITTGYVVDFNRDEYYNLSSEIKDNTQWE